MKKQIFWKLARTDGFDFYTGKTINYRENIGKTVKCPEYDKNRHLCSYSYIYASRMPDQCFVGAKIPCSVFKVEGVPLIEVKEKAGFAKLKILEECKPEEVFKWKYAEVINPILPFEIPPPKKITKDHINLVKKWFSIQKSGENKKNPPFVKYSVSSSVSCSVQSSISIPMWNEVWVLAINSIGKIVSSKFNSIFSSVKESIFAYAGSIFAPVVTNWIGFNHKKGEYPFQPAVDLWKMGLISSFQDKTLRLHGGKNMEILWEKTYKTRTKKIKNIERISIWRNSFGKKEDITEMSRERLKSLIQFLNRSPWIENRDEILEICNAVLKIKNSVNAFDILTLVKKHEAMANLPYQRRKKCG